MTSQALAPEPAETGPHSRSAGRTPAVAIADNAETPTGQLRAKFREPLDLCIEYDGDERQWRAKAAELLWLDLGIYQTTLHWPTAVCPTPTCLNLAHLAWEAPKKLAYPPGVCVYCGISAETRDHLLPRTWTGESVRRNVLTVPACRQCNTAINDRYAPSITARRKLSHDYIARKNARLLRMPEWSPDEVAELGDSLRSTVERGVFNRRLTRARLAWPEDDDYDLRAMQISGIENPYELGLLG